MIENAIKYVKQIFADDCSGHDDYHTMRVYRLAMQIAEQENADMLIVQLAALLHDVDDNCTICISAFSCFAISTANR